MNKGLVIGIVVAVIVIAGIVFFVGKGTDIFSTTEETSGGEASGAVEGQEATSEEDSEDLEESVKPISTDTYGSEMKNCGSVTSELVRETSLFFDGQTDEEPETSTAIECISLDFIENCNPSKIEVTNYETKIFRIKGINEGRCFFELEIGDSKIECSVNKNDIKIRPDEDPSDFPGLKKLFWTSFLGTMGGKMDGIVTSFAYPRTFDKIKSTCEKESLKEEMDEIFPSPDRDITKMPLTVDDAWRNYFSCLENCPSVDCPQPNCPVVDISKIPWRNECDSGEESYSECIQSNCMKDCLETGNFEGNYAIIYNNASSVVSQEILDANTCFGLYGEQKNCATYSKVQGGAELNYKYNCINSCWSGLI